MQAGTLRVARDAEPTEWPATPKGWRLFSISVQCHVGLQMACLSSRCRMSLHEGVQILEFFIFGLTLVAIATLHGRALQVAISGLALTVFYKFAMLGLVGGGTWLLVHLPVGVSPDLLLLIGFAVLANQFELSDIPELAAAAAAAKLVGRRGPARHRVRHVDLPRQHRRRDHRRGHGQARLSRPGRDRIPGRHRRGVERRRRGQRDRRHDDDDDVDQGVSPLVVATLSWPRSPLSPSSRRSPRCSSSASRRSRRKEVGVTIDWPRGVIVAVCCCRHRPSTSSATRVRGARAPARGSAWPVDHDPAHAPVAPARLVGRAAALKGATFLVALVAIASMMPVQQLPPPLADRARPGLPVGGVRQHPADRPCPETGRLRLGALAYAVGFGGSMMWFGRRPAWRSRTSIRKQGRTWRLAPLRVVFGRWPTSWASLRACGVSVGIRRSDQGPFTLYISQPTPGCQSESGRAPRKRCPAPAIGSSHVASRFLKSPPAISRDPQQGKELGRSNAAIGQTPIKNGRKLA